MWFSCARFRLDYSMLARISRHARDLPCWPMKSVERGRWMLATLIASASLASPQRSIQRCCASEAPG
jgi:hypothetical protein